MKSQSKIQYAEDYEQIILRHPSAKKAFCSKHSHRYTYVCSYASCGQYLCGKMECIDEHFHEGHLSVFKIDFKNLLGQLQTQDQFKERYLFMVSQTQKLKEKMSEIEHCQSLMVKGYENFTNKSWQIFEESNLFLMRGFEDELSMFIDQNYRLEQNFLCVKQQINWDKIWINITSEEELIRKLAMTFLEVEYAEFMPVPITFETFSEREDIFKEKERVNKNIYGMVTALFSEQGFVVGQFFFSKSLLQSKDWVYNFLFVVDPRGVLRKYTTYFSALEAYPILSNSSNQLFDVRLNHIKEISKTISEETGVPISLRVTRMYNYLCANELVIE